MGVRTPPKTNSPTPKPAPNPQIPPQFILSLSKDELGIPPKSPSAPNPHPILKIPHPNPLTNPKPMFYTDSNAKTSSPRTAQNGGSYGVKSRPG